MTATPDRRVVLLVGASSGIGRAVAHRLAARGDDLVLASRGRGPLERAGKECRELGTGGVSTQVTDVRDAEAVDALVARVCQEHGRIDAVVNTAAVIAFGRFEDVPAEVFEQVVRTNLIGTANVARSALAVLRAQGAGTLVLMGSVLGEVAVPSMTPYVVSKWGVRSLARQLAVENRDLGAVRVCLVNPGAVDTPIYEAAGNYQGHPPKAPFPVLAPEQVAAAVESALARPRRTISVGPANTLMRLGFQLVPFAFDALVGPLYRALGTARGHVPATAGNVLHPTEETEGLRGTREPQLLTTGGG
ncbi:MAG TPA: SDR family NAD(P)-dependent oxidoreductase [Mycobacteriales bacterium]|nr:SDR family NAD(P)-dependent oxidoreductase [Mycobacteriales bacterium]